MGMEGKEVGVAGIKASRPHAWGRGGAEGGQFEGQGQWAAAEGEADLLQV